MARLDLNSRYSRALSAPQPDVVARLDLNSRYRRRHGRQCLRGGQRTGGRELRPLRVAVRVEHVLK